MEKDFQKFFDEIWFSSDALLFTDLLFAFQKELFLVKLTFRNTEFTSHDNKYLP
jgi:hypothetical protein